MTVITVEQVNMALTLCQNIGDSSLSDGYQMPRAENPDDIELSIWGMPPPPIGAAVWHDSGEYRVRTVVLDVRNDTAFYQVFADLVAK